MIGTAMLGESVWCADRANMAVTGRNAWEMAERYAVKCLCLGLVDPASFNGGLEVDVTIDGVETTHLVDLYTPPLECRVRGSLGAK